MTLHAALMRLDLEQLADIAELPQELVLPRTSRDPEAQLTSFAAFLRGQVTWDTVVASALDARDLREAVRLFAKCQDSGNSVSEDTTRELNQRWKAWFGRVGERRREALTLLAGVPMRAPQAHAQAKDYIELLEECVACEGSMSLNSYDSAQDLDAGLLIDLLDKTPSDLDELKERARLEISQDWEGLVRVSSVAWQRLLREAAAGGERGPARTLLDALPHLALNRRLKDLEMLSNADLDCTQLLTDLGLPLVPVPARPARLANSSVPSTIASGEFRQLRKFSEAVVHTAPDDGRSVESNADLLELGQRATREASFGAAGRVWLRAAKASSGKWGKRALGRGLLAAGRARMEEDSLLQARPLLLDALELIGTYEPDIDVFRTAVRLTLAARVWPHHRARTGGRYTSSVREWAQRPALPFARDAVVQADLIDQAALIWVEDLTEDRIGEAFLQAVGSDVADDATLYRRCLERLLTPALLRRDPRRVCERLKWLLSEALPSNQLDVLLDRLTQELGEFAATRQSASVGRRILNLIPELVDLLDMLPTHTIAPVASARETLPAVLEHVVGAKGVFAKEALLTVTPICKTFYPEERTSELLLPLLLKNDGQAARACNIQVGLRVDGKELSNAPLNLVESRHTSPDLEPGDEQELVFAFDLDRDVLEKVVEVRLIPEVRTNEKSHRARTFTVEFRPSRLRESRKSPFTTGLAVDDESFVGRERELKRLVDWLVGGVRRVPVVVGIRRIGKTSLVQKALRDPEVGRRFYPRYWDVEARPDSDTSAKFLADLAEIIRDAIPKRFHDRLCFHREPLRERPFRAFEEFIQSIQQAALPKRVLIAIDECDRLLTLVEDGRARQEREGRPLSPQEALQPEVFGALRKALMTTDRISLVLAGLPALGRKAGYENRLFGLMSPLQLRPFSEQEAMEVIDAARPFMEFSVPARHSAFRATGFQPYLLQVLCDCLFHRMRDHGRDVVAPVDVQEVIAEELLPNESNLADYISLIGDDRELLFGLAEALAATPQSRRFVSVHEVGHALRQHGFDRPEDEIRVALSNLVPSGGEDVIDRPLVERASNDRSRFRLVVGLLGEYLREAGPYP